MVFMGAATIDGNAPLIEAAEADLDEMAVVGSGDALNIFAQVHRGRDVVPRRAWIKEGMSTRIDTLEEVPPNQSELDAGLALMGFIKWALKAWETRPQQSSPLLPTRAVGPRL